MLKLNKVFLGYGDGIAGGTSNIVYLICAYRYSMFKYQVLLLS